MSAVYEDGTPIPDDKLAEAQAAGLVRFASADAPVNYVDDNGVRIEGKASDYATIIGRGGRIEPQAERAERQRLAAESAEFESPTEIAKTAGEGVVRGVPLIGGTLYAGLVESGIIDRERSQKRQAYNPGTEMLGEVLSPVPGAALGKALGLGAKALKAGDRVTDLARGAGAALNAPTTFSSKLAGVVEHGAEHLAGRLGGGKLAQKVTGYAAGGAIDGAQYAVNSEIAQAAQEGRLSELDGKMLLHALGHGAAVGAVIGGALGTGIEGAGKVSAKMQSYLKKQGSEATLRAAGLTGSDITAAALRKGEEKVMRAAKRLQDEKLVTLGNSIEDNFKALEKASVEAGKKLGSTRKALDSEFSSTVVEHIPVAGIKRRGGAPVTRAVERRSLAIDSAALADDLRKIATPASPGIAGEVGAVLAAPQLRKFEKALAPLDAKVQRGEQFTFQEIADLRSAFAKESKTLKSQRIPNDAFEDAQRVLEDHVLKRLEQAEKAGQIPKKSLEQYIADKARYEDLRTLVDLSRKRVTQQMGKSPVGFADQVAFGVSAAAALASGDTSPLEAAATGAAGALLRRGISRYQNPALSFIAQRLDEFASRKNAATEAIVVSSLHQAASEPRNLRHAAIVLAEHDRKPTYMHAVAATLAAKDQGPHDLASQYGGLAEGNEQVYMGYLQAQQRSTDYLVSQLPKPMNRIANSLTPNAEEPMVSTVEQRRFADKFAAVRDPVGAMAELANGELNLDKIEAVKATAPELYEEMRAGVALGLAKSTTPIPYKRRIQLGLAFDLPADPSLLQMPEIQSSMVQQQQPSGSGPRPSSTMAKQQSQAAMLPSQTAGM